MDGDATLSSPNFKIKGGSSEAASIITVAEGSITIGEGTSDANSDPVTIKSNVFGLTSFGAATETYSTGHYRDWCAHGDLFKHTDHQRDWCGFGDLFKHTDHYRDWRCYAELS